MYLQLLSQAVPGPAYTPLGSCRTVPISPPSQHSLILDDEDRVDCLSALRGAAAQLRRLLVFNPSKYAPLLSSQRRCTSGIYGCGSRWFLSDKRLAVAKDGAPLSNHLREGFLDVSLFLRCHGTSLTFSQKLSVSDILPSKCQSPEDEEMGGGQAGRLWR